MWICECFACVYVHADVCTCAGLACVCWPWRYTMGHLYRPSAPTKLPLGVGVLTMFWTISSNKSQPKLLVSVSLAKWQTVHPPKSSLRRNRQGGRRRQTEGQRNRFQRQIFSPAKKKYSNYSVVVSGPLWALKNVTHTHTYIIHFHFLPSLCPSINKPRWILLQIQMWETPKKITHISRLF